MFTIGFRGCDFHEKDACGSAGSASLTGSGLSAGSSHAVPALKVAFCTLWKATKPNAVDVPALAGLRFPAARSRDLFPRLANATQRDPTKQCDQMQPNATK